MTALVAIAALTGCAAGVGQGAQPPRPDGTPGVYRGEVRAVEIGALTAQDVARSQTAFGVDLLHAVCVGSPGENVLISATSAAEALGLLYPAARGDTASSVGRMLHLPSWSPDLVAAHQAHTRALVGLAAPDGADLDAEDAPDSLRMSNRIWTAPYAAPEPGYLDDTATAFDAGVESLDFEGDPVGSTDRINESVRQDTAGLIEKLFDEALKEETYAVLTNAVHLDASWSYPFSGTFPAPFEAPGGETTVDMMVGSGGEARSADGWVSVDLPYRDGTLTAVAVLPPAGTNPCAVDLVTLDALQAAPAEHAAVDLPRLHLEQKHELLELLEPLGLPRDGDYSGLGSRNLRITDVVQKTYLDVDEDGTEAAAATGVVAVDVSAGVEPERRVVLDRPFLLLLTDTETRSPLFTAVVNDPSS